MIDLHLLDGFIFYLIIDTLSEQQLELWNPKTDLKGGYEMKKEISMDKKYRTRDSRDVELITINSKLDKPIVGIVDGETHTRGWHMNGLWSFLEDDLSQFDLMEVNPYADFKIDDKVLVTNNRASMWRKGHFMGVVDGKVVIFDEGKTSYTSATQGRFKWDKCIKWEDRTTDMVICND